MELSQISPWISFSRNTILLLITISLGSCGIDIEDSEAPVAPTWVEKSSSVSWPERGIDAYQTDGIFLEWYASEETDVVEYKIFRSLYDARKDTLKNLEQITTVESSIAEIYSYVDHGVEEWEYYGYWLIAQDNAGNLSKHSDTIYYSVTPSATYDTMIPNSQSITVQQPIQFSWDQGYWVEFRIQDYIITIIKEDESLILRERFPPSNYTGDMEVWVLPDSLDLEASLYMWRIDVGADYQDGKEKQGGESEWATFRVAPE